MCPSTPFPAPVPSPPLQKSLRRKRAQALIQLIADYNHECFRDAEAKLLRASLRLGVSPDLSLAYIDILYFDEIPNQPTRPLCDIGQPKLPIAFKFAGLGSYFTPWQLDTNDILLQAVAQTDVASVFIDEAWITFIADLNTVLRTLQVDGIHTGDTHTSALLHFH